MTKLVLPNLSFVTCGAAFAVHRRIGRQERERVYKESLKDKLIEIGLGVKGEVLVEIGIAPNNKKIRRFLDLVVEDLLAIEVKASEEIFSAHYLDQLRSYLQEARLPLGLLINFCRFRLSPIRVLNPNFKVVDLSQIDESYHSLRFAKIRVNN